MFRRSGTVQEEDATQPADGPDEEPQPVPLKTRRSKW